MEEQDETIPTETGYLVRSSSACYTCTTRSAKDYNWTHPLFILASPNCCSALADSNHS
jgi:hypothetical protein